jgi:dihydrofolate reductase
MFNIIVAIAENNCIGKGNDLPWNIPEDLKHFKEITAGKTVLMGSKTFESIMGRIGKPLPNRKNVVVGRDPNYKVPEGVLFFNDLDIALDNLKDEDLFIIGGASIYKQTLDRVDKLFITHVHQTVDGDAFFPQIDPTVWKKIKDEPHEGFSFAEYERVK